ncbi:MAG: hypothetical protein PUF03_04420 [Lachnospiraceae bacterium]|nr:hypothetical protein [Lachnospiraceae bacterium]
MKFGKKRLGALLMVIGLMMSSMTVCAEGEYYQQNNSGKQGKDVYYYLQPSGEKCFYGAQEPDNGNSDATPANGDEWMRYDLSGRQHWYENEYGRYQGYRATLYQYNGENWILIFDPDAYEKASTATKTSSSHKNNSPAKYTAEEAAKAAEGRAELAEAVNEGFADTAAYNAAKEANKSAGEYYNNAVTDTPGIENAIPVAQGGNLVVDGVVTGMTATISKVDGVSLDEISRVQQGRILNVVSVSFPATEATINFYMPGVEADANIVALQYIDGQWVDVPVVEVRADHVVLGAVKNGKVAFVLK